MAVAHKGKEGGVTIAEVNLKLILDTVSEIKIGREGYAYVVDRLGRLIAHPDLSLVLRKTDLSGLPQVAAALADTANQSDPAEGVMNAPNFAGRTVLTAGLTLLSAVALLFGAEISGAAATLRLAGADRLAASPSASSSPGCRLPSRPPHGRADPHAAEGAARLGAGELGHRIELRTGDEVETLGDEFNRMAAQLQESHSGLERRVEERTRELSETTEDLARSVEELTTLREVGQAVSSTLDLATVLETIVTRAVALSGADAGAIYRYPGSVVNSASAPRTASTRRWRRRSARRRSARRKPRHSAAVRAVPVQLPDLAAAPHLPLRDLAVAAGFARADGAASRRRPRRRRARDSKKTLGEFSMPSSSSCRPFASQSCWRSECGSSAGLTRAGQTLAIASQHKSQFHNRP
jgi:hypothetical protein